MIRLNVSEETLKTGVGLERVVQQIFWYQIFYKDSVGKDLRKLKLLKDMYEAKNGDTIKLNRKTKLIEGYYNLVKPLCDTATRTFLGRVPDITTKLGEKEKERIIPNQSGGAKLQRVWIVGEKCREMAESVSDDIIVIDRDEAEGLGDEFALDFVDKIRKEQPSAVLWDSDAWSKRTAPRVAAMLQTGLCADCTALETDGENLYMYRPAFSGNIIAKIGIIAIKHKIIPPIKRPI